MARYPDDWNRGGTISLGDVRRTVDASSPSEKRSILEFVRLNMRRIRPMPDVEWVYEAASEYLFQCITESAGFTAESVDRYTTCEVAHELVNWFNWLVSHTEDSSAVQRQVAQIETLYRSGNAWLRNCIETGILEHVLEYPRNRPLFSHWNHDPVLSVGYAEALRWGEAHSRPNAP